MSFVDCRTRNVIDIVCCQPSAPLVVKCSAKYGDLCVECAISFATLEYETSYPYVRNKTLNNLYITVY